MNGLFETGRDGFLDGTVAWSATISAALLNIASATDTAVKGVTSSTNATPIVVTTATAHGFTTGDLVYLDGHATNTAANGFWQIGAASGSTFSLLNPVTGGNSTGNGVGTGGYCVDYGSDGSTVCDNYDDFDGCLVGTKTNLASLTATSGVADAADVTFTSVTGSAVQAILLFKDTGTASTSRVIGLITGKFIVTADATLSAGTALVVEPLQAGIASGTVLAFHTGQSATLSAPANAGDRVLTVSSTTVTSGARALAPATGSGLPVTPNGGNIIVAWDNGVNKIFKL